MCLKDQGDPVGMQSGDTFGMYYALDCESRAASKHSDGK